MPHNDSKVTFITSGYFPIPATMGGAVEAIVENFVKTNEEENLMQLQVYSCYDAVAVEQAKEFPNTTFHFIKTPIFIRVLDRLTYITAKYILKKSKSFSYRYIFQRLYFLFIVAVHLKREDAGKVILENHASLFLALKLFSNYKKYHGRYYYHLHNLVTSDYGCRNIIAHCKCVIGVSDYINGTLHDFLGSEDRNSYAVLRNKIDRTQFLESSLETESDSLRRKFDIKKAEKVVLFTGRFTAEKGIRELLQAFKLMKLKNAKLLIVGSYYFGSDVKDSFSTEMKSLVADQSDQVSFTGFIEYSQIPKLYSIADVVVLPSIWDDPAPLTVIEALTCKKPLITTDSGGIPEYTSGSDTIVIKRDKDLVKNLAKEMDNVLSSDDLQTRMSRSAERLTNSWTITSMYYDLNRILVN